MGYRSQVAIALNKHTFWKEVGEDIIYFQDCDIIQQREGVVTFIWEDVKWYSSYSDVEAIEKLLERISLLQDDYEGYAFIRVGEETGDIETRGEPWHFDLRVHTEIDCGGGDPIDHDKFFAPNSVKFIRGDDDDN